MSKVELIQFISSHRPALSDGDYIVNVKQILSTEQTPLQQKVHFSVLGPRFALKPEEIFSIFPPQGSAGDHSNVLASVTLNRSTLPWERSPVKGKESSQPWLALLLFDDVETPKPKVVKLSELKKASKKGDKVKFPGFRIEPAGQHEGDVAEVIDVPWGRLKTLLPGLKELGYLTHVRRRTSNEKATERAVIMTSRLPKPDGGSCIHLVSLEGRYKQDGSFDNQAARDDDEIRLVSLKHWNFSCEDHKHSFQGLLQHLNTNPLGLCLPSEKDSPLAKGYVPLQQTMPHGGQLVSWYRSPLSPQKDTVKGLKLPAASADALMIYDGNLASLDVTYASAWELGRWMMLNRPKLSLSLLDTIRAKKRKKHANLMAHEQIVPNLDRATRAVEMPKAVTNFFKELVLLKGLPFQYLVPDEEMLPAESLRFFSIDQQWLLAMIDGALAVDQTSLARSREARKLLAKLPMPVSGFLLRSEVVSGWPHLMIDASKDLLDAVKPPYDGLKCLRRETLGQDTMICLFDGSIQTLDLHLQPEALHFGVDASGENNGWRKTLRNKDGKKLNRSIAVPFRGQQEGQFGVEGVVKTRVFDISKLKDSIKSSQFAGTDFSAAQFGMEMIEGVPLVRFKRSGRGS
ncbi:MAG: hypothetical protein GKR95_24290 [Gammaproteobacteria bacterium]|nr:hypothetical protein [Gammaproteobacteria bacterium]